ncbi:hypothetical protein JCM18909_600 [Cutibacterium acnes JCM 18909]|nr:hypothetical protein JCM18909_600 [Cutibacterium acnes JCM 18909]
MAVVTTPQARAADGAQPAASTLTFRPAQPTGDDFGWCRHVVVGEGYGGCRG